MQRAVPMTFEEFVRQLEWSDNALTGIDWPRIRALPLFAGIPASNLDDLFMRASVRRIHVGERAFHQGQRAKEFFMVLDGRLKVTQTTSEGRQIMVRVVHPGDLFGLAQALQRPDYPATSVAAARSLILCWPNEVWSSLIETNARFAINAMQTVGQRLQEAHARIREISTENVERRLAHAILRLVDQAGQVDRDGIRLDLIFTSQDLAALISTTQHSVSRLLSAWERHGIVQGGGQKLLVRDKARLKVLADGKSCANTV
jgi:CRP-like cAMP-binding protein